MASAAEAEAVDFEPEEDDLMDEDGGMEAEPSPHAPLPKLKSAITGGSFSGPDLAAPPKKTKGRGFREESDAAADRNKRFADKDFDSLFSDGGPGPQRCQFRFLSLPLPLFLSRSFPLSPISRTNFFFLSFQMQELGFWNYFCVLFFFSQN